MMRWVLFIITVMVVVVVVVAVVLVLAMVTVVVLVALELVLVLVVVLVLLGRMQTRMMPILLLAKIGPSLMHIHACVFVSKDRCWAEVFVRALGDFRRRCTGNCG
jgi:hypothetical protein